MIFRHTDQDIQYYFSSPALNQSAIKVILNDGIQAFRDQELDLLQQEDLYYKEDEHLIVGSAVDCIITRGMDEFNKKYAYSQLKKKPPETIMSIIRSVFDGIDSNQEIANNIDLYKEELWKACDNHSYYMNRSKPTLLLDNRVDKMLENKTCQTYWTELIATRGKQLLSEKEKSLVTTLSTNLLTHKHTTGLFKDYADVDIIYQMPLYFTYDDVLCKILPDMIRINHNNRNILVPDIKTTRVYVLKFNDEVRRRRYDIQGSFYVYGVSLNREVISKLIGKDISSYRLANPAFIVESKQKPGTPIIFPMTDELVRTGREGDGRWLKGWIHGVDLYKSWRDIEYSLEKRFETTNGIVWLDKDFEYTQIF